MNIGLPRPLQTTFELTNKKQQREQKTTQNVELHFLFLHLFQKSIFPKIRHSPKSVFYVGLYDAINILYNSSTTIVVGHTA